MDPDRDQEAASSAQGAEKLATYPESSGGSEPLKNTMKGPLVKDPGTQGLRPKQGVAEMAGSAGTPGKRGT